MAEINDIHDFIHLIERKERGGFTSDAEIDMYLERAQMECFTDYFKEYGKTQVVHDALTIFKVTWPFSYADCPNGLLNYPDGYTHLLGLSVIGYDNVLGQTYNEVRYMNENQLANALKSELRKPTITSPIGVDKGSSDALGNYEIYTQLYPKVAYAGEMIYLRKPAKPKYGFTQSGRTITYNPTTSVQLEWTNTYVSKIIGKAMMYLGLNMDEKDFIQFGAIEANKTT